MSTVKELAKKYKSYTYDELLARAKKDCEILLPVFHRIALDGNGKPYVVIFMCGALASDGRLAEREYRFVKDLLDIGKEEVDRLVGGPRAEKAMTIADRIFDSCKDNIKSVLVDLCLCFAAADNNIENKEIEFIARLLA